MKIVHICSASNYTQGFGYQDNLLTKYQQKLNFKYEIERIKRQRQK